jgi:hypothetical protein
MVQKLQAALFSHFLCIFIIKATRHRAIPAIAVARVQ